MHFDPSEDQALVRTTIEHCIGNGPDLAARRLARADSRGISTAVWARLADAGMLALAVGEDYGGLAGDRMALLLAMEAIGRALAPVPFLDVAVVAGALIDAAAGPAQHESILQPLIRGETLVALACWERAGRFDFAHVETRADQRGEAMVLNGIKTAVLSGGGADHFVVSARDGGSIGLWLVAADAPGVSRRAYRLADGSLAAELGLRDVVPWGRLAGGAETLRPVAALARAAAAAEMLGIMTLLFDLTLAHVKTRIQFNKPIGSFQVIQHRMADAYVLVEQARSQIIRAGLAPPAEFERAAAGAKAFVGEAALLMAHTAVQMHGGMGITDELAIGHGLKRLRVLTLSFGDTAAAIDDYRCAA
jgi:hypothetical protein